MKFVWRLSKFKGINMALNVTADFLRNPVFHWISLSVFWFQARVNFLDTLKLSYIESFFLLFKKELASSF